MTIEDLRNDLPGLRGCSFLNYAATAPLLQPSADRMTAVIRQGLEPMPRHFNDWLALLESSRREIADLIFAVPEEITFVPNTSTALSIIAASVPWQAGDRVLYPADEFPSNRFVWENLQDKGVCAEPVPCREERDLLQALQGMDLSGVRLVALSAVSYADGRSHDVAEIVRLCHAKNILVAVDAIQAVGAVPVSVKAWGCDFLACGGQKWLLGPVGSGFLYIKTDLLPRLHVPLVGWASSRDAGDFSGQRLEFVDGARRFEPGLPDIAAVAGLSESVRTLTAAGWKSIYARIAGHQARLCSELDALDFRRLASRNPANSGIVTVEVRDAGEQETLHREFTNKKIYVTLRNQRLRISPHAVTSNEEISGLLSVLRELRGKTGVATSSPAVQPRGGEEAGSPAPKWRRALVTGASRGLGEAIALELAKQGCSLILVGRDQQRLEALRERLVRDFQVAVDVNAVDLASPPQVERWLNEHQALLDCDVLVNNAAMGDADAFAESDLTRLRQAFEVNFFAPAAVTRKIIPLMLERGNGAILNIVTSGARCALPLFSGYSAGKGALWAWSESLGREVKGRGVTVTTFLPPHMESATHNRLGRKAMAYYRMSGPGEKTVSADVVARRAMEALAAGRLTAAPLGVRLKLAVNALFPDFIEKKILKTWS
ncbi:MAG: aminotransferase class V-fold PLP-dependent enzyme [Candidatus Omnitrophota bacterium]|nr:aminotransferase class V-fold PLP-dependent enzyme [Candidatus Omnitrophota bacterium]MDZ4242341.1 aminotransferase class V-fold PLP-dependent enzyme [Candidatus Omnitrophota bacterium]